MFTGHCCFRLSRFRAFGLRALGGRTGNLMFAEAEEAVRIRAATLEGNPPRIPPR